MGITDSYKRFTISTKIFTIYIIQIIAFKMNPKITFVTIKNRNIIALLIKIKVIFVFILQKETFTERTFENLKLSKVSTALYIKSHNIRAITSEPYHQSHTKNPQQTFCHYENKIRIV